MGDPSAERQIANVYLTEWDTVEGSFAVNGGRATAFRVFNYQF